MIRRIVVVGMLLLLQGCYTATRPSAVEVGRWQWLIVPGFVAELASKIVYYYQVHPSQRDGKVDRDHEQVRRIAGIVDRLVPQVTAFREDARDWDWSVHVVNSLDVNAWCLTGGKIVVYTGLLHLPGLSDEGLALVIGHEISHALREHSRESMSVSLTYMVASVTLFAAPLGMVESIVGSAGVGYLTNWLFNFPLSRVREREADRMGLELVARAGYDPRLAISVFEAFNREEGAQWWWNKGFFVDHPDTPKRIEDMKAHIPKVLSLYSASHQGK
jgi:Zn-dependent protease with chaperone function